MSHFPRVVELELSNRCNLDCVMCPRTPQKLHLGDMSRALLDKVLDETLAVAKRSFRLHGIGEPLLSPQLRYAVERIKGHPGDHRVELFTNAHLLNRETARFLLGQGVDELVVSVAAATPAGYEAVRKSTKFDLVLKNTVRLIDERERMHAPTEIAVQLVRLPAVEHELEPFVEFWSRFDVTVLVWHDLNWGRRAAGKPATLDQPPCKHLVDYTMVCWDGRVGICCVDAGRLHVVGDLTRQTVREAFNSEVMERIRAVHERREYGLMPICADCSFRDASHIAFEANVKRTQRRPGPLNSVPRLPILP
jgi:MoaA/NifB/PqqE/SkfB family radical SAM enzyme